MLKNFCEAYLNWRDSEPMTKDREDLWCKYLYHRNKWLGLPVQDGWIDWVEPIGAIA